MLLTDESFANFYFAFQHKNMANFEFYPQFKFFCPKVWNRILTNSFRAIWFRKFVQKIYIKVTFGCKLLLTKWRFEIEFEAQRLEIRIQPYANSEFYEVDLEKLVEKTLQSGNWIRIDGNELILPSSIWWNLVNIWIFALKNAKNLRFSKWYRSAIP